MSGLILGKDNCMNRGICINVFTIVTLYKTVGSNFEEFGDKNVHTSYQITFQSQLKIFFTPIFNVFSYVPKVLFRHRKQFATWFLTLKVKL